MKESRSAVVDEYGALDAELNTAELKKKKKRLDELGRKIQGWYEEEAADQTFEAPGDDYTVAVSTKAMKRDWKPGAMVRLAKFLGAAFFKVCRVNLSDFDDRVAIDERGRFIEESQTGARRLESIAKTTT